MRWMPCCCSCSARCSGGSPNDPKNGKNGDSHHFSCMSSLVVANVRKTWSGAKGLSVEAIRDASLQVSSGEFVAILGPSGGGKSTLLELCAGLEPISGGFISIDGQEVRGPNPK